MIHPQSKKELDKHLFLGCSIIELGDQFCDWEPKTQGMRSDVYFKSLGFNITSIDWHGKNGAINIDLSTIAKDKFSGDILTDFGTLEHVKNTYNALVNCFNFTKEGGLMIHVNPDKTYAKHGYYYFTEEFWKQYAKKCNLEIASIYSEHPYEQSNPALEVYAILRKTKESKMISEEEFKPLKKHLGKND